MSIASSVETQLTRVQYQLSAIPRPPRYVLKAVSLLLFVAGWHVLVAIEFLGFGLIPTPAETLSALWTYVSGEPMTQGGDSIYVHSYHTIYRVALGLAAAIALAIPLGLLVGWSPWWNDYVYPAFEVLRPIPPVAWVPISLIAFATEIRSIVFVVFVGAFFPILLNTMEGVKLIDDDYVRAVRSLGGSRLDTLRHVVIPHVLPSMITGTMIGIGIGWIAVVAAEMISGNYGVGYITYQAYRLMQTETVIVGIIVLGAYGAVSSLLVARLGGLLMPWTDDPEA